MHSALRSLGRLGWLALVLGLFAMPASARADQAVHTDFDGDGRRDHATIDASGSVRVWLSSTQTSRVLPAKRPLRQVAAVDLDHDGRPELVGVDRSGRLLVWQAHYRHWKVHHRKKFRLYHLVTPLVPPSSPAPAREVDEDDGVPNAVETSQQVTLPLEAPPTRAAGLSRLRAALRSSDERAVSARRSSRAVPRAPPSFN